MRSLAIAISLGIHTLLLWSMYDYPLAAPQRHEDHVFLTKVKFKKKPPSPPTVWKKPKAVKTIISKPTPRMKPMAPKRKYKPQPKPAPVKKIKPLVVKREPKAVQKSKVSPAPVMVAAPEPMDMGRADREREKYLAMVLGRIEENKFYPGSARRRGIEAILEIRFKIMPGGALGDIRASGGHNILKRAAENALISASPFPQPPKCVSGSMNVEYKMEFALR